MSPPLSTLNKISCRVIGHNWKSVWISHRGYKVIWNYRCDRCGEVLIKEDSRRGGSAP
jgi:formylmethanofuran dehydrogenase subunit E